MTFLAGICCVRTNIQKYTFPSKKGKLLKIPIFVFVFFIMLWATLANLIALFCYLSIFWGRKHVAAYKSAGPGLLGMGVQDPGAEFCRIAKCQNSEPAPILPKMPPEAPRTSNVIEYLIDFS